ncbi:hypothetical protein Btru_074361 [Bulinus truncatus]|nr:hypothetical protein Btru_074361 [Bulinus truncatus]
MLPVMKVESSKEFLSNYFADFGSGVTLTESEINIQESFSALRNISEISTPSPKSFDFVTMGKKSRKPEAGDMADDTSSVDADSLRDEFESNTEWSLRRKFLHSNIDSLSLDRLICLSRCFVNVAVYGCSYPPQVMKEINERSHGILEEVESERKSDAKQNYSMSFVKASGDAAEHHSQSIPGFRSASGKDSESSKVRNKRGCWGIQFVKSSEILNPENQHQESKNVENDTVEKCSALHGFNRSEVSKNCDLPLSESLLEEKCILTGREPGLSKSETDSDVMKNKTYDQISTSPAHKNVANETNYSSVHIFKTNPSGRVPPAHPLLTVDEYFKSWKSEKNSILVKFRKLAYEVVTLKTQRPNAIDQIHSAAHRVPIRVEFNTEPYHSKVKNQDIFLCHVFMDGTNIATGHGFKLKDAKLHAYETSLQKIFMPYLRVINLGSESRQLEASKTPFSSAPPDISRVSLHKTSAQYPPSTSKLQARSQHVSSLNTKYTNLESINMKRRYKEFKSIHDFVIIEPMVLIPDCTPAHTLRRSADFNKMLIEYDSVFCNDHFRCILKIENHVLADVKGKSKAEAANIAAAQGLNSLRRICWVIKTKKLVDSDVTISKEEMLTELNDHSDAIYKDDDNIGHKMLKKMGWSGGGVGKDGSGIAEPVSLKSVLNRQGLGLSAARGISDEFRKRVREVIQNYASSGDQEDLMFSNEFRQDERQIIHDECRKLNLRSKSRGKGQNRHLCVHRKRSAQQLFEHIMSYGGETAKYKLVPPGSEVLAQEMNFLDGSFGYSHGVSNDYCPSGSVNW